MGKKAKLKKERKEKRKEMESLVEEWSTIPKGARYGPCASGTCTIARCLDPWVTRLELHNKTYDGPIVVMCWSKALDDIHIQKLLRINGEDIGEVPSPGLPPDEYEREIHALMDGIGERYGAGATFAVVQHLVSGAANRGILPGQRLPEPAKA